MLSICRSKKDSSGSSVRSFGDLAHRGQRHRQKTLWKCLSFRCSEHFSPNRRLMEGSIPGLERWIPISTHIKPQWSSPKVHKNPRFTHTESQNLSRQIPTALTETASSACHATENELFKHSMFSSVKYKKPRTQECRNCEKSKSQ